MANQFLIKNTMQEMKALDSTEIAKWNLPMFNYWLIMKRKPCQELSYDVKYFGAITGVDNTDLIH
ncbi:hypothetical protein [Sphingobacterium siyangense]